MTEKDTDFALFLLCFVALDGKSGRYDGVEL